MHQSKENSLRRVLLIAALIAFALADLWLVSVTLFVLAGSQSDPDHVQYGPVLLHLMWFAPASAVAAVFFLKRFRLEWRLLVCAAPCLIFLAITTLYS